MSTAKTEYKPIFLLVHHPGQQSRGPLWQPDVCMGIEELGHKVLRRHEAAIIILDAGILQKGGVK